MHKLAIVVGHNSRSQGAVRQDTGESEFVYNGLMADMMVEAAEEYGIKVKVFRRVSGGGYTKEIRGVYAGVDAWGAEAAIELHFNSAGTPSASGTETLSSGSRKSLVLATEVQMELVDALGLKNRGIKIRNSRTKGRGYQSLVSGRAPAIITEPFFASSAKGREATDSQLERDKIAHAILEGAMKAFSKF